MRTLSRVARGPLQRIGMIGRRQPGPFLLGKPEGKQISIINLCATDTKRMPVFRSDLMPVAELDSQFVGGFATLHHVHFVSVQCIQQCHHGND